MLDRIEDARAKGDVIDKPDVFCSIVAGDVDAEIVYEDDVAVAFLDHRPVFLGHTLVAPRVHIETLADLPPSLVGPFFAAAQRVARAVESGLEADGSFVAINNKVSQSVPHLHTHVVPRRRKDGLRGFFWPRQKYRDASQMAEVAALIRAAL
ncbi:MAG TPA: HIT family protein [Actinomycetota bacterium]|nr:HIT family protein [Actinomycetota bacterium]